MILLCSTWFLVFIPFWTTLLIRAHMRASSIECYYQVPVKNDSKSIFRNWTSIHNPAASISGRAQHILGVQRDDLDPVHWPGGQPALLLPVPTSSQVPSLQAIWNYIDCCLCCLFGYLFCCSVFCSIIVCTMYNFYLFCKYLSSKASKPITIRWIRISFEPC